MSELPLVSVVVPCRNRERFLVETIESALQQDYPRIECIVVDAASTDGSLAILKSYGDRIRWVSEPDRGHADAINKGWRMSRGDILAWLNADDTWVRPDAVSRAVRYLGEHPEVDLVYGDCEATDIDGRFLAMSYVRDWDLEHAVVHCDYCIAQPASFIRRAILERVGWVDEEFISKKDHELWLRIGLVGTLRHLPGEVFARERIGPGYLAEQGHVTARACVQLTRKFFTLPGVPPALQAQKSRALSNAYIEGMRWAYECGRHWDTVLAYAGRAVLADRSNRGLVYARLRWYAGAHPAFGRRSRRVVRALKAGTAWVRGQR